MKITRKQLRQLIKEATKKSEDKRMTALTDHLDDLIRAKDSAALKSALKDLQGIVDHYSEAEILQ